jgi:hypothetical protein
MELTNLSSNKIQCIGTLHLAFIHLTPSISITALSSHSSVEVSEPISRHLYAGYLPPSNQVSDGFCPDKSPGFALPSTAQIPDLQEQNLTMRLDQLCLLFEAVNLMTAEIVTAPLEPGLAHAEAASFSGV